MTYLVSECEIRLDDQGVRAAEAQLLGVDTILSNVIYDPELCPDITRKTPVGTRTFLRTLACDIYKEISVLLSLWYQDIVWHVAGDGVPKDDLAHCCI